MKLLTLTTLREWFIFSSVFLGILVIGIVLRFILIRMLERSLQRNGSELKNVFLELLKIPSLFWIFILAAHVGTSIVDLPAKLDTRIDRLLLSLFIISLTFAGAEAVSVAFRHYSKSVLTPATIPVVGLTRTFAKFVTFLVGGLILLDALGINITPLLTTLGIGGLAVALALQDTLANFFAGVHIILSKQIRVGNRIKLGSGEEGHVMDIGWRSTSVRDPSNYLIIIPNSKLSQNTVFNYNMPEPTVNIVVPVNISYGNDPERAERVLKEELRNIVEELPGFVKEFEPVVRLDQFSDTGLRFLVVLQVQNYDAQFGIWGELNKRIFKRLHREGIEIPSTVPQPQPAENATSRN